MHKNVTEYGILLHELLFPFVQPSITVTERKTSCFRSYRNTAQFAYLVTPKKEIDSLETIFQNRDILIITFLSAFLFWSLSFLDRIAPSFFSQEMRFLYILSIPAVLLIVFIIGFISLLLIVMAKRRGILPSKPATFGVSLLLSFLIITPLALGLLRYIPRGLPAGSDIRTFDSVIWKSESSTDWKEGISRREEMLKDVIEKILPGKSRQEIETALGPSLNTFYFSSIDKDLIYYLGPERDGFLNIDSEWLLIWIDEDGKFERYMLAND